MARVLGIDYGTKRIGLAVSDEGGTMAFPYGIVNKESEIADICRKENISHIVVGLPRALGTMEDTQMTKVVRKFADRLRVWGVPVDFEPEFLSTKEASGGPTEKESIDAAAAAIILQSYLERKKNMIQ